MSARRQSAIRRAEHRNLGDLFEYKLKDPITIRKNQSALLPIVQSNIDAEKVSVWNERSGLPRPQRALWLTNTSGLTLDGGSFSVLEEETFAGEGIFDPIRPGEKWPWFLTPTDLALNVRSENNTEREHVTRVVVDKGLMTQARELREKKTYTFRNEDTSPRMAIVEHPVRVGYQLRSDAKPSETTADWMRFRLPVPSKQSAVLVVEEGRGPFRNTFRRDQHHQATLRRCPLRAIETDRQVDWRRRCGKVRDRRKCDEWYGPEATED